ncbi:hypothetical protein F5146DRAFT_1063882 [Armillaria mellea]|nr:hypothetical protein F5146DRAFT_1063882 [Armillaria mellea]
MELFKKSSYSSWQPLSLLFIFHPCLLGRTFTFLSTLSFVQDGLLFGPPQCPGRGFIRWTMVQTRGIRTSQRTCWFAVHN